MLATIGYQVHSIVIVKHGNHSYGLVEQVGVDSSAAIPAFNRPRLSEFSDMVSRPLFSPSRRFTEKEDVEKVVKSKSSRQPASTPAVDGAELDRFRLAGLVVGDDHTIAVIRDIAGNRTWRVVVGGELAGWRVEAADFGAVRLSKGVTRNTIHLRDNFLSLENNQSTANSDVIEDEGARSRSGGENEREVGRAMPAQRDKVSKGSVWDDKKYRPYVEKNKKGPRKRITRVF